MNHDTNPLNWVVVQMFGNEYAALIITALMVITCAYIIYWNGKRHHTPSCRSLESRLAALSAVQEAESTDDAQEAFVRHFDAINAAMIGPEGESAELGQAWTQFRETILDETESPMRATARAEAYFLHLSDDTKILAWWANIFVAVGLTFTFLGIIAALTTTVGALNAGTGSAATTGALVQLLTVTSVKFWTSVAGVGASIALRFFDMRWHKATLHQLEDISRLIDRGTLYSPPQRIANEQLREIREQTAALKSFSHELVVALDESLGRQMQPMVSVLGSISSNIEDFKSGSFDQIGKELGTALSAHAGTEMQELGAALTNMTGQLSSMHEKLEQSGQAAGSQIEGASGQFTAAMQGIQTAFDQMRSEIAENGKMLSDGAQGVADRNAELLANAGRALEEATLRTAQGLGASMDAAIAKMSEDSAAALEGAFAGFEQRFIAASAGMVDALRETATRMESLASGMQRAAEATGTQADRLTTVNEATSQLSASMTRAAVDFGTAAAPVSKAATAIGDGSRQIENALATHGRTMDNVGTQIVATSASAERAWTGYQDRFEAVDEALGKAVAQLGAAANEHAEHLNEQVGKIDNALAGAVEKLAASLDSLEDLADQIGDLLDTLKQKS